MSEMSPVMLSSTEKSRDVELTADQLCASSGKGYRMVRATQGVLAGAWFFEVTVEHLGTTGHTRLGWCTEKGDIDGPVGADQYSYAYRDLQGCKVHAALREPYGEAYGEGDVLGFYINLPNGAALAGNEVPVPGSEIIYFRNGTCQGTAYKDITAGRYFPAASMYTLPNEPRCRVRFNFGPEFDCMPAHFNGRLYPQPICSAPLQVQSRTTVSAAALASDLRFSTVSSTVSTAALASDLLPMIEPAKRWKTEYPDDIFADVLAGDFGLTEDWLGFLYDLPFTPAEKDFIHKTFNEDIDIKTVHRLRKKRRIYEFFNSLLSRNQPELELKLAHEKLQRKVFFLEHKLAEAQRLARELEAQLPNLDDSSVFQRAIPKAPPASLGSMTSKFVTWYRVPLEVDKEWWRSQGMTVVEYIRKSNFRVQVVNETTTPDYKRKDVRKGYRTFTDVVNGCLAELYRLSGLEKRITDKIDEAAELSELQIPDGEVKVDDEPRFVLEGKEPGSADKVAEGRGQVVRYAGQVFEQRYRWKQHQQGGRHPRNFQSNFRGFVFTGESVQAVTVNHSLLQRPQAMAGPPKSLLKTPRRGRILTGGMYKVDPDSEGIKVIITHCYEEVQEDLKKLKANQEHTAPEAAS